MSKRVISFLLATVLLCTSINCYAASISEKDEVDYKNSEEYYTQLVAEIQKETVDNDVSASKKSYRINFKEGIGFDTPEYRKNLQEVSDEVVQVVFAVDAGVDTFAIGHYFGDDEKFSLNYLNQEIVEAVDGIKREIETGEKLSRDNEIDLKELELQYIEICSTEESVSNIASKMLNVSEVKYLGCDVPEMEASMREDGQTRSHTIDGSYHYNNPLGAQPYISWYNQLTGTSLSCAANMSSPHTGDGNNRYASGYQWFPNQVEVNFGIDAQDNENTTYLWYRYDQATLNNLNVDTNEALEVEVQFYNTLASSEPISKRGHAFQKHKLTGTWTTNQPNYYLDTALSDNADVVSFCVGVEDTTDLVAGNWYYWAINGEKGYTGDNYPNDGRFRATAQRSYRVLGGGALGVFAEEHEPMLRLGISVGQNWVVDSAWEYGANHEIWRFNSATDPVR